MNNKNVLVRFNNVVKKFGDLVVLDELSKEFYEGETHVICGRSGAGKSTLIRTINYLEEIDSGELYFEDIKVNNKNARKIRKKVSMVFQDFNLFPHLTIMDNAILGQAKSLNISREEARARAMKSFERVGLKDKIKSKPAELSGGQKQRAAIVRALSMRPDLILFDEPTTSLDPELVGEVLGVIKDIALEGRSMIVVTHQMGFAREAADKISFMDEGKIVETKPPEKMFENPEHESTKRFINNILHSK